MAKNKKCIPVSELMAAMVAHGLPTNLRDDDEGRKTDYVLDEFHETQQGSKYPSLIKSFTILPITLELARRVTTQPQRWAKRRAIDLYTMDGTMLGGADQESEDPKTLADILGEFVVSADDGEENIAFVFDHQSRDGKKHSEHTIRIYVPNEKGGTITGWAFNKLL